MEARDFSRVRFHEPYCLVKKVYPANALKICSVFETAIKPRIKEILGDFEQ